MMFLFENLFNFAVVRYCLNYDRFEIRVETFINALFDSKLLLSLHD